MSYEPIYEKFGVGGPDGRQRSVEFKKAGFLAVGDHPEVYFFDVDGQQVVVGLSGEALTELQRATRSLSREEKIDVAGLRLKQEVESGRKLVSENLYVRKRELGRLLRDLGILA